MHSKDPDILIHPRKGRSEHYLPEKALFCVNPAEARIAEQEFSRHDVSKHFLHNSSLLVDKEERLCIAGPALGAPAAGLVMEKLVVLGVKRICLFSCCGVIDRAYSIGDIILATSGVSGEGVSNYYGDDGIVYTSPAATDKLRAVLHEQRIDYREGVIWSTDAPYRESRSELARLHDKYKVVGVDMEFTALCSIAAFRGVSITAIFVVSDELWGSVWKPGFGQQAYKKQCRLVIRALIRAGLEKEMRD
ncbi:MAG: hypothetical protein HKP41_15515 [Desulfobacterales bacterium]|nr:hypothetical protein [Deltaproteobacteria bacterium]NNK95758.1 hypothetical protein [Desulfobacterales bacterium]